MKIPDMVQRETITESQGPLKMEEEKHGRKEKEEKEGPGARGLEG